MCSMFGVVAPYDCSLVLHGPIWPLITVVWRQGGRSYRGLRMVWKDQWGARKVGQVGRRGRERAGEV